MESLFGHCVSDEEEKKFYNIGPLINTLLGANISYGERRGAAYGKIGFFQFLPAIVSLTSGSQSKYRFLPVGGNQPI
jgi:hypothetical protein